MHHKPVYHAAKTRLKELAARLASGEATDAIRLQFKQLVRQTSPLELAHWEKELSREHCPREVLLRLHGLQVDLFREMNLH
jgi:DUF438 domain-containing protein